jgi:hypothetical protein
MTHNILNLIVLAVLVGTFATAPMPEPSWRSLASRVTTSDPAVASRDPAGSGAVQGVWPRKAQAPDGLDMRAAQAAIEADGYERVSVLGRGADGTWRAKAYKGTSEVRLTVDGRGRVTAE